jgi:GntR family transcriptional regulator
MADPKYRVIADELRSKIESGEWDAGYRLPTELELRLQYDASRNTVRDAIKTLVSRGLIETQPGRGTFVVEKITPFVITLSADPKTGFGGGEGRTYMAAARAQMRQPSASTPRVEIQVASGRVRRELGLEAEAEVVSRHQQMKIDGKPWSLQTSYYPKRFVDQGAYRLTQATSVEEGVVAYLNRKLGLHQVGYQDRITARVPNGGEIEYFRLIENSAVLILEQARTAYDQNGSPFRLTETVWPADRNQLVYNTGDVPVSAADPSSVP